MIHIQVALHIVEEIVDEGKIVMQRGIKVNTIDKYELKKQIQIEENKCIYEYVKSIENSDLF